MDQLPPDATELSGKRRRCLRAVLAADVENFGGLVSVDETNTLDALWITRRIAREELATHGGWLFGMPGDGIFAVFESAVDALRCALCIQTRLAATPKLNTRLRVGVHLGEVLFRDDLPFGEALVIAARLESLADPGGILVSAAVMEAVAPRISASFCERGVFNLKHSPRRISTFSVSAAPSPRDLTETSAGAGPLDRTMLSGPPEPTAAIARPRPAPAVPAKAASRCLPKAVQLVVPATPPAPPPPLPAPVPDASAPRTAAADAAPFRDCVAELTQALTMHVGPIARILVKRHTDQVAGPLELVEALAAEIPTKAERLQFLIHARELVARQRR